MIAHTIKRIVCLGCLSLAAADMSARDRALEKSIRTFLRDRQATVAVAVLSDGRMIASIEGKTELPTMSVCKFYQALAVLVANSFEDDRTNEATIAGISRIVYDYFVERE